MKFEDINWVETGEALQLDRARQRIDKLPEGEEKDKLLAVLAKALDKAGVTLGPGEDPETEKEPTQASKILGSLRPLGLGPMFRKKGDG